LGNFLHGNREASVVSEKEPLRPVRERLNLNPDMHAAEESDWLIVPEKEANEANAKEPLEGRSRTKENTIEPDAGSTQSEQTGLLSTRLCLKAES
jgi:hypothetical protein